VNDKRYPLLKITLAVLLLLVSASVAGASDRWFHVHVDEGEGGAEVMVNLPLSLVESAVKMIPAEIEEEVRIELDEADFDLEDLRALWQEMRAGEDATYVTVREEDQTVEVRKQGEYLLVNTTESTEDGARVDVRFPLVVVDALFSGEEGRLDFAAAVRALADYGDGDMVTVRDRETTVRVWVDDRNASD
jgi:hypothetical protein